MGNTVSVGDATTPEELAKRADRRKRIAEELYQTEQTYVASMAIVVEVRGAVVAVEGDDGLVTDV